MLRLIAPALMLLALLAAPLLTVGTVRADELPTIHYVAGRFPPYTQTDANDQAIGPTAALIATLGQRIGRSAPLSVQPFARAIAIAEHEPNTLIALIARNPARERKFQWICPVLDYDVAVFRRHDRPDVMVDKLTDLTRWRIGGVNRDMKTEFLQRAGVSVQIAADEDEATRLLLHGHVDAMPAHPATIQMRLREMGERSDTLVSMLAIPELNTRLYLAFSLNTAPQVVTAVGEVCRAMTASGEIAQLLQH
jgi:polar amino acid transport system substrate-binding protein